MNLQKLIKEHGTHLSLLLAALALLLFIPACLTHSIAVRVILIILITASIVGGGVLLFLSAPKGAKKVHYFLYDPKEKRSISRTELDEKVLLDKMTQYLRTAKLSALSLWDEIPDELNNAVDFTAQFKPLVAYQMLSQLAKLPDNKIVQIFTKANNTVISFVCRSLAEGEDKALADYIFSLKKDALGKSAHIAPFFKKNANRFVSGALHYVQKNFDRFYINIT